jgi:peptide/nickel transport system substrate-binding protein
MDPDDDRVWTIDLQQGVTWHDGTPFTAADVVYTYESVMGTELGSPFRAPYVAHIERVEAIDDHRVRFHLIEPYATFLTDLVLGIVPKHVVEMNEHRFPEGVYVGTGPYQFVRRAGDRRLDLRAVDNNLSVRHLVFRTIKDEGTRLLALLGGSVDFVQNGVSPVLTTVLEQDERLQVTYAPSIAFSYVALNLRDPALSDRRVRQALAYAIPRKQIIDTHFGGHATLATGMMAPFHWAYEEDVRQYEHAPDKARALLSEAGYGVDGVPLTVTIKISTHRLRRTVARVIADSWRRVGVNAQVRSFEFGTFYADIKRGDFQAYLLDVPEPSEPDMYFWLLHGLGTPTKDPETAASPYARADRRFLSPGALDAHVRADPVCRTWTWKAVDDATRNWVQRAFQVDPPYYTANRMYYANPLVDCRLDQGQRAVERSKRIPLYQEVQQILAEDVPVIPLWHPDVRVVTRRKVTGYTPLPNLRMAGLLNVQLLVTP